MLIQIFNKVYRFIINNKILRVLFYTVLIIYPFLFLYFYQEYDLFVIGYHTNVIIPIYVIAVSDFVLKYTSKLSSLFSNIRYVAVVYFIIELLLLLIRPSSITTNTFYGQYISPLETKFANYYQISDPYQNISEKKSEFFFKRKVNGLGLSDKEWSLEKPSGTYRIICLGDSFTEGDGVDYESSYPSFLQRKLSEKYTNIEVLNAGKRGSDPFFNYKYLVDTLIAYQPDMIVQSFTANDYYFDMVIRGGLERFGEDGQLKYRYHYWWESIYASSFVFRIFIQAIGGYDQFLIKKSTFNQSLNEMKLKSVDLFRDYKQLADEKKVKLIVFTIPFAQDFTEKEDFYNLFLSEFIRLDIPFYNLQSCYNDYVQSHQTNIKDYYWKKDGHHNAKGYEMMASCIEDIVYSQMDR